MPHQCRTSGNLYADTRQGDRISCRWRPGIRVDSCLYSGYAVPPFYDSLIAKLIVYGDDRDQCLSRLRRALQEFVVEPIPTTLALHERLVDADAVKDGSYNIRWLEEKFLAADANSDQE